MPAPQQSGRVHKFLVSSRGTLREGESLDRVVLYGPDGEPIDLASPEAPESGGYKGLWQPDTDYPAGSLVGVPRDDFETSHRVYLYGTDVVISAGVGAIPGFDPTEQISSWSGGDMPAADYERIQPGPQSYDYADGYAYFFFDLAAGGTVDLSSTVFQQVPVLYNELGETLWSGGLSIPIHEEDLVPGRYFVALQNGQGGAGTETVTLTLSDGAAIPDPAIFWYSLG